MPVSLYGRKEIGYKIGRNPTHDIGDVFGRIGVSGDRSLVTNQLRNGLRLGQEMGAQVDLPKKEEDVECMELNEMHTYVGSKKLLPNLDCRPQIWKAVCQFC
ncbi:hypothetical protein EZS27_007191 [termite gut metagenome]|uniref:Uncharacterized protein n=1 Tax=termite gut metagenome TaxID=433724 RepID=A0A5J4SIW4_9ZZZZ